MRADKIIRRALRLIKAIDASEGPDEQMQADALDALNSMLAAWSSQPQAIYAPVLVSHTLVADTASYTWGVGGDINSARPVDIRAAYVTVSGTDYPLQVKAIRDYAQHSLKAVGGIPAELTLRTSYPLAMAYLFPVPDGAYTFKAEVLQPFSSYTAVQDMGLPPEFEDPITYQLAVRLGPEYGGVPQDVAALAVDMLRLLKRQYAKPVPAVSSSPFYARRYDDIDGGF